MMHGKLLPYQGCKGCACLPVLLKSHLPHWTPLFLHHWLAGWVRFSAFWSLYLCPFWFPLVTSASDTECHDPPVPCEVSFLRLSFLWCPWPTTAFNSALHNEVILNDISTLSSTDSKAWYYLYLHLDTASFCCEKSCNYFTVTYHIFHSLTDLKFKFLSHLQVPSQAQCWVLLIFPPKYVTVLKTSTSFIFTFIT